MADENEDDDVAPGSRVRSASAAAAERIRNSPPPPIHAQSPAAAPPPNPTASPESTSGQEDGEGSTPSEETKKVSRLVSDAAVAASPTPEVHGKPDEDPGARWLEMQGRDQKKANAAALETNNRAAALARENEDLKKQLGQKPGAPTPKEETPAPTAEPDITQINTAVQAFAAQDPDCRADANEWKTNEKRLSDIVTRSEMGVPTGGELVLLSKRISALNAYLDPKSVGLEAQELDLITQDTYRNELEKAELKKERLLNEFQRLETRNGQIQNRYDKRLDERRTRLLHDASVKAQASKLDEQRETIKTESTTEWNDGLKAVTGVLDAEDVKYINKQLLLEANAIFEDGKDIPDFKTWIAEAVKQHLPYVGQRAGSADAARARELEKVNRQPAPRGTAAVADVPASSDLSPRERRKQAESRAHALARNIRAV